MNIHESPINFFNIKKKHSYSYSGKNIFLKKQLFNLKLSMLMLNKYERL
jgi:hypothetical protein